MSKFWIVLGIGLLVLGLVGATGLLQQTPTAKALPPFSNVGAQEPNGPVSPNDLKTLTVNVASSMFAEPTKAEIFVAIETLAPTAKESQSQNAAKAQAVMDALSKLGITGKSVQTSSYTLYEKTEWDNDGRKMVKRGYETSNALKITVNDLAKTGSVIDAVTKAGASRVNGVNFTIDDAKISELKKSALTNAGKEAKAKAQAIADGLGVTVVSVQNVNENGAQYIPYYKNVAMYDGASVGAPSPETPLSPGDVEVNANLTVTFVIA